jgi:hypothetical protein
VQNGEKPYLIVRVGLNRTVLLEAAGVVSNVVAGAGFDTYLMRIPRAKTKA